MKLWPHKKYVTARAVIVRDNKLLAFHRKRFNQHGKWIEYYSIPGGKIERGESPETAAERELKEEMGVDITVNGLIGRYKGRFFEHYVYAANLVKGEPVLMADSEEAKDHQHAHNQFEVVWVDVNELTPDNLMFYGMFHAHIMAIASGKDPSEVLRMDVPDHVY